MKKSGKARRWLIASAIAVVAMAVAVPKVLTPEKHTIQPYTERPKLSGPDKAREWRLKAWRSEDGSIPADGLQKATEQILAMSARSTYTRGLSGWKERGPYNVAGRTRSMLIDPRDSNKMFMGSVSGGIWVSTDGGANWSPVSDRLPNLAITCMAFDPANPDIMYAGTGEGFFNSDAVQGSGLLKSTDAGVTWEIMAGTSGFGNINRVAIAPTNSNLILLGTQYGGIRRTTNGGSSWATAKFAQVGHQVLFHPTDSTKAVAALLDYDFGVGTWFFAAYYSVDSGASWTEAAGTRINGFSRTELAYAPSNPSIVYANVGVSGGQIYKSTNGGQSYADVTTSGTTNASWYNNGIFVDPSDANKLILTGLHTYKSTNGGASISQISNGYILTNDVHPDVHLGVPHPGFNGTSNTTFFVCTDGGIHKTTSVYTASSSSGWTKLTINSRTTQFYGVAGHGASGRIIGGTQDNGTLQLESGTTNAFYPFGGDGGWCAIDPTNSNYMFGEYVTLRIWRSTNGGTSAGYITTGLSDAGSAANFIAPFVMDPNNPNTLIAGGASVWRSTNAKAATPTWSAIKSPVTDYVSAIAVAPGNSNIIYVGHNDGKVYKTTNGTAVSPTWTTVDDNGGTNPLPNRYIGRILIDPSDNNKIYVGLGGFNADNLWMSTNGGSTFSQRTGSGATALPSAPIRAIARHPSDANLLHVGTEVGICESGDGGLTWSAPNKGPVNVSIDELVYMSGSTTLLAATHGRGIWTYGAVGVTDITGPASVTAGDSVQMTVTIDGVAGGGGVDVTLSSSATALTVPTTVTVPEGEMTATFNATSNPVASATPVTVTASVNGISDTHNITVNPGTPAVLSKAAVKPLRVPGGNGKIVNLKVVLAQKAPPGGITVNLSSSHPSIASVPATLFLPAGAIARSAPVSHVSVPTDTPVTFTASYNSESVTSTLDVLAPRPLKVRVIPNSVQGGNAVVVTATVYLDAPAPAGGTVVPLLSTIPAAAEPAVSTVTVPAGGTTADFTVNHFTVATTRLPKIRATLNGKMVGATLEVRPPIVKSIVVKPIQVVGGSSTVVTATITLNAPAHSSGAKVLLSDDSLFTGIQDYVIIPGGETTKDVTITHVPVATQTTVTFSAFFGVTRTDTLVVNPPGPVAFHRAPIRRQELMAAAARGMGGLQGLLNFLVR